MWTSLLVYVTSRALAITQNEISRVWDANVAPMFQSTTKYIPAAYDLGNHTRLYKGFI